MWWWRCCQRWACLWISSTDTSRTTEHRWCLWSRTYHREFKKVCRSIDRDQENPNLPLGEPTVGRCRCVILFSYAIASVSCWSRPLTNGGLFAPSPGMVVLLPPVAPLDPWWWLWWWLLWWCKEWCWCCCLLLLCSSEQPLYLGLLLLCMFILLFVVISKSRSSLLPHSLRRSVIRCHESSIWRWRSFNARFKAADCNMSNRKCCYFRIRMPILVGKIISPLFRVHSKSLYQYYSKYLKKSTFPLHPNVSFAPDKPRGNSQPIPKCHTQRLQEHQTTKMVIFAIKRKISLIIHNNSA